MVKMKDLQFRTDFVLSRVDLFLNSFDNYSVDDFCRNWCRFYSVEVNLLNYLGLVTDSAKDAYEERFENNLKTLMGGDGR